MCGQPVVRVYFLVVLMGWFAELASRLRSAALLVLIRSWLLSVRGGGVDAKDLV